MSELYSKYKLMPKLPKKQDNRRDRLKISKSLIQLNEPIHADMPVREINSILRFQES